MSRPPFNQPWVDYIRWAQEQSTHLDAFSKPIKVGSLVGFIDPAWTRAHRKSAVYAVRLGSGGYVGLAKTLDATEDEEFAEMHKEQIIVNDYRLTAKRDRAETETHANAVEGQA